MPSKSSSYAVPEEQYTLHETIGRTVVLSHDTNRNKLQQAGHCLCELNHLPRFCEFECVRTLLLDMRYSLRENVTNKVVKITVQISSYCS
ncbi:uncharacterized protein LOC143230066 isoform X2 [Tachypleus tridentatus]|uniref:uncharacterized protein LOC143230066 isoform X2 n=1 Tax=Tachypleus tridentatus TaxID=6853 RepID=UPI003FD3EF2C